MYLASLFIDRSENNAHRILVFGIWYFMFNYVVKHKSEQAFDRNLFLIQGCFKIRKSKEFKR